MYRKLFCASVIALATAIPANAVTFEFTYTDDGSGFNDPEYGADRRAALELAGRILGSSALGAYDAVITVTVDGSEKGDLLASAASLAADSYDEGGSIGTQLVVPNKILFGDDFNGDDFDAEIAWNFTDHDWELDIDVTPSDDAFDFYSTVYHELAHALGWADSMTFPSGTDAYDVGIDEPGNWNLFDSFISDKDGNWLINTDTFLNTRAADFKALALGGVDDGLFFNGEHAVAANGGNLIPLYTPHVFEEGSSVSHLDDEAQGLSNMMMLSASDTGHSARLFSDIALGVLRDLGYEDIRQIKR